MEYNINNLAKLRTDLKITNTIISILKSSADKSKTFYNDSDLFYCYESMDINSIIKYAYTHRKELELDLTDLSTLTDKDTLIKNLNILTIKGIITMNDVIADNNTYKYIPSELQNSGYTRNYANIKGATPNKILLISDTHIGSEIEDFNLINSVFDYSINKHHITDCIHLGDVFNGIRLDKGKYRNYSINDEKVKEIIYKQLETFKNKFPNEIKIIAVEGNHDKNIINFLKRNSLSSYVTDEHFLRIIKNNFHMFKARENGYLVNVSNLKIKINHYLQFNNLFPYVKTYEVNDDYHFPKDLKNINTGDIDLYLSGHFHYDMHYAITDNNGITQRHYEIIPSLSKLGYNRCVAKILRFIYDKEEVVGYGITPLYFYNQKISEKDEKIYPSNYQLKQSKCLQKRKDYN